MQIRPTQPSEIIDLRWRILRAGLPRESAHFDGDEEATTRHFAALMDQRVIGCATILRRPWENQLAWQLRGMAIEPGFQGQGIGRQLLELAEHTARDEAYSRLMWCNARVPAAQFYEKLGWVIVSDNFEIPTAGPHVKMTRML